MRTVLNYILSTLFYLWFGLVLLIFHPIQILAFNLLGHSAHQKVVFLLNWFLVNGLRILGTKLKVTGRRDLPSDRPKILIANHSSLHDITGIYGYLGYLLPVFVSKKSLAKGIPSVSYNLRKSGAALIERKDRIQSIAEILRLGKLIRENNFTAVIFPEGTRSRHLRPFKIGGLTALLKKAPNALVLPLAIKGAADLYTGKKTFPLTSFQEISWNLLEPIDPSNMSNEEVLELAYERIASAL